MKNILLTSLVLNIVLSYNYLNNRNQSFDQTVLSKKYQEPQNLNVIKKKKEPQEKKEVLKVDNVNFEPIINDDEYSFAMAQEEMDQAKREFYNKAEFSSEALMKKQHLIQAYWNNYSKITKKRFDWEISFIERKKLLKLEVNLVKDLEQTLGREKWQKYKKFVDQYNRQIQEARKTDGRGIGRGASFIVINMG